MISTLRYFKNNFTPYLTDKSFSMSKQISRASFCALYKYICIEIIDRESVLISLSRGHELSHAIFSDYSSSR